MNEDKWDKFFELLYEVVHQDVTWQEKQSEARAQAKNRDCLRELEEFAEWFI